MTVLAAVVAAFKAEFGARLADPAWALDCCEPVSVEFAARCRAAGITATVIDGIRFGETPEFPGVRLVLDGHYAVLVADDTVTDEPGVSADGTVYDWTARQFDTDAPVPLVQSLAQWRATWSALAAVPDTVLPK